MNAQGLAFLERVMNLRPPQRRAIAVKTQVVRRWPWHFTAFMAYLADSCGWVTRLLAGRLGREDQRERAARAVARAAHHDPVSAILRQDKSVNKRVRVLAYFDVLTLAGVEH